MITKDRTSHCVDYNNFNVFGTSSTHSKTSSLATPTREGEALGMSVKGSAATYALFSVCKIFARLGKSIRRHSSIGFVANNLYI